jgi:hypothetical protein
MIKRQMYGRAKPDLLRNASCSPTDRSRLLSQGHRNLAVVTEGNGKIFYFYLAAAFVTIRQLI